MWLYSGGSEKAEAFLDKLVEAEKITEEEQTAYTEWLDDRPDAVDQLLPAPGEDKRDASSGIGEGERVETAVAPTTTGRITRRHRNLK